MPPRTPLLRPNSYFAERDISFARVFAVFGVVVFAGLATVYGVGFLLVGHIDGTVTVDNPERPPDVFCNDGSDLEGRLYDKDACDAPREVARDVDPLVWDAVGGLAGPMLGGMLLLVGGITVLLHAGSWLAGGTNGVLASFAVTVWGMAPMVVVIPGSLVTLWVVLDPVTVSAASGLEPGIEQLTTQLRAHQWVGTVSSLMAGVWSVLVWRRGLEHERGLDTTAATAVAATVGLVVIVGGVV